MNRLWFFNCLCYAIASRLFECMSQEERLVYKG